MAAAVVAMGFVFLVQFGPSGQPITSMTAGKSQVAMVRGAAVSETEFFATLRLIGTRVDAEQLDSLGLRQKVMDGLVERELLLLEAEKLGLRVGDEDLSRELRLGRAYISLPSLHLRSLAGSLQLGDGSYVPIPVRGKDGASFDLKTYDRNIKLIARMSQDEFREFQRRELLAFRMRQLIRSRVHVAENEAKDAFRRDSVKATADYVRFDASYFRDIVVDPSPAAVAAYAALHADELKSTWEQRKESYLPECRRARHILVKVDSAADETAKATARSKLDAARARLTSGESFAAVAKAVSEDATASEGGDLGCVGKGRMVEAFEKALFDMKERQTSEIVESPFGFHLIHVDAVLKDAAAEEAGRLETTKMVYLDKAVEDSATAAAKAFVARVQSGSAPDVALQAVVDDLPRKGPLAGTAATHPDRPSITASLPFSVSGNPSLAGLRPNTGLGAKLFALAQGAWLPEPVTLSSGVAVVGLRSKTEPDAAAWEQQREGAAGLVRAKRQEDALVAYAARLRETAKAEIRVETKFLSAKTQEQEPADGS